MIRSQNVQTVSADTHPVFTNPALKPIAENVSKQFAEKFPDATPLEIANMTKDYFGAIASELGSTDGTNTEEQNQGDGTDWLKFLQG